MGGWKPGPTAGAVNRPPNAKVAVLGAMGAEDRSDRDTTWAHPSPPAGVLGSGLGEQNPGLGARPRTRHRRTLTSPAQAPMLTRLPSKAGSSPSRMPANKTPTVQPMGRPEPIEMISMAAYFSTAWPARPGCSDNLSAPVPCCPVISLPNSIGINRNKVCQSSHGSGHRPVVHPPGLGHPGPVPRACRASGSQPHSACHGTRRLVASDGIAHHAHGNASP